jgi:type III restriction enzyme
MPENFEVPTPILNGPFDPPAEHWRIEPDRPAVKMPGRRAAGYYYRPPKAANSEDAPAGAGEWRPLELVNLIRERMAKWQAEGRPGLTRTSAELIAYWQREGRQHRLFFAQLEAAETIVFLNEARADFLQGIAVARDEPSDERKAEGFAGFRRLCCKMATGSGKSTVMAMLAAWSLLNKAANRGDARFSDTVLAVCPNVTIRNRLQEIDPRLGAASLYRTRDLVPERLMPELAKGRVIIWNWHVFEPQGSAVGGTGARVVKAGKATEAKERFIVAGKTTSFHGKKYITPEILDHRVGKGELRILKDATGKNGQRVVTVIGTAYVESDTALVNRVLHDVPGKKNILVLNDEAHHAYRILGDKDEDEDEGENDEGGADADDGESDDYERKEATVWIDGLDKVGKLRGINFCVDLSATPYFISRVGQATNTIFPWTVSDFGLTDAIESGLVKIPQLAVRDNTGAEIPGYFNIWRWILPKLTPAERGGRKSNPKPEAILKWANPPIAMLGGLWEELRRDWAERGDEERPPVFILVCKNTRIAKVIYDWLGEDKPPAGIPSARLDGLLNRDGANVTIRVDTKVVQETEADSAKSDDVAWMRRTLDTVGKRQWPLDAQGGPIYPDGFKELAEKLKRPLHPPGRDIRCIVSVGMLTEGWDCNTVTHIVGLRPFMSQLLCEQVVGRGLRRRDYQNFDEQGRLAEEVAKVFGVPFEVVPFKENKGAAAAKPPKRHRVHALPEKAQFEIAFPRVEGYRQAIRNRVTVEWDKIAVLWLDPNKIPPEVQVKGLLPTNQGRPSLMGPGALEDVTLNPYRKSRRIQQLAFEMARELTRQYAAQPDCSIPVHALFPQIVAIADRYLREKVIPVPPAERIDAFLSPYYGWVIERLVEAIKPDADAGEAPEIPAIEANRPEGTTGEVDFWTSREVRPAVKSHVNYVVADTKQWEQSAAYQIDRSDAVAAFVKNAGLGFAIPYLHNGAMHDYEPDFIVRLAGDQALRVILETKGYDPLKEVKRQAAERWVAAVNADGRFGQWRYVLIEKIAEVGDRLRAIGAAPGLTAISG